MRRLRRILITVVVTLAVIFVGVYWVAPVALSFYAAKKVPPVARIVPTELKDKSVSVAPGTKLSYVGYEFEVPWSDLDETQTKLYPKDKPEKTRVVLAFRSGLRLMVTAIPAHEWTNTSDREIQGAVLAGALAFGQEALRSDYSFIKGVYEFAPNKMHYWSLSPRIHYGEQGVLIVKSIMLLKPADTGIFNIQNQSYKGFQQGNAQVRQDRVEFELYSDEGSVEMTFFQKDYKNPAGVTQPEINRIVQSLRKAPQNESTAPRIAQK
jgi:hypothetical protein